MSLEPRLVTAPDGLQTGSEPHQDKVGSPVESQPVERLDRVWPDAGPDASV